MENAHDHGIKISVGTAELQISGRLLCSEAFWIYYYRLRQKIDDFSSCILLPALKRTAQRLRLLSPASISRCTSGQPAPIGPPLFHRFSLHDARKGRCTLSIQRFGGRIHPYGLSISDITIEINSLQN